MQDPPPPPTPPGRTALLVIDMQNDLLAEGGASSKRHTDPRPLAQSIAWLVRAARRQGRAVVWVTSYYGEVEGDPAALHDMAHTGSAFCTRGTWGAEISPVLAPVLAEREGRVAEWLVEKRWYSPFRDTPLHETLQAAGVTTVILCGAATDAGILAAARDARRLGYGVEVLEDATLAGSTSRQSAALREIESLGARRRRWIDLLGEGPAPVPVTGIGSGDTTLWCGALRDIEALHPSIFEAVEREVAWSAMYHRGGEVPRRVAIQGALEPDGTEPLYRHPADEQPPLRPFTPTVDLLRREVERVAGHPLNHCLLQLYRTGRDWISEHSDKTLDLVRPSFIVNVSLGRQRTMVLRPKRPSEEGGAPPQKVPLPHGSLFIMDLETNRTFYHAVRKEGAGSEDDAPRISLTFRHIGTYYHPATQSIWGTGAPSATRQEAESRARTRAALPDSERADSERAEAERMLRLFREENIDPTFEAASYRPGFEVLNFRTLNDPAPDR